MFFPNACDVMAGFLGGRSNNINNSTGNAFVHESFKTNFTTSASAKKDEVLTSFPGTLTLTNNCQVLNCPECSKPCTGYTVVNTQVRQCSDSSSWYNCNVCCARFPALRDLEAHVATQVRYCCCVCHAGFHCRELYENHIAEHKNDLMNHQQVHLHQQQQPVTVNCDAGRKTTHSFAVDQLATVSASTSASGGFLPSITQTMSIAGQIPDQVVAFTELARSQQGSFFVAAPPSTNYVTQDYISIMSKDANGKETYNINSFQLNKIQGKDLLREAYCGNSNITSNLADAEAQKEATEMQNISNQESYATIAVSIQSLTEAGKSCDFQNQTMTQQSSNNNLEMEAGRQDNPQNQPSVDDKMANPPISFVQFSDQPPMSHQQFVCTLCGKGFKTKITLGKHARTVHKIESATGADLMDFLTTSVTAVARLQQPSPSNTAVPGLDKINLLEGSALAEAMFNSATKEQTANVIGTDLVEEKKIFQSVRENEDVHQEKKRRSRGRKGPLGLTSTSRYQSSRVKYTCEVCDKEFIDKMKHRVHVRTHTGEKPYACDICGKLFNTRSQVNRHRLHIHELEGKPRNRQYKNRQSGDSTGKSAEMTGGVNVSFGESLTSVNTSQQNNTGSTEGQNTSSAQESLNQSTASNDALANSIVYCSKTGQPVEISDGSSGQHRRRRGLHRIYFCPVCEKPFQDKVKHAVHLRTHTGEKPYACIVCDKRFNTRSQVNRHMSVHKSIFQNPLDTTFSSEGALEGIKSEDVGQEVVPEVQLSQQDSQNILRLQVGVQSGNLGQDEAPQNGKTQSSKKKRNRDWQQSHMCSFCGQNFATPSGLSSHTRNRHKDQIVFNHNLFDASTGAVGNSGQGKAVDASKVCQVCGKAFRAANSLRMHMIRHSSIKPHKCPICERCFITKFESNRCQRRHSKTKAQDNTFQQEKANQMKVGSNDATVVQAFIPENLPQAAAQAICQRTGVVEDIATVPRTEAVAFPVTTNFSELADPSTSNLPVNLSSQESWLQQGYIQTSIQQQQQNRDAFMQKAVVAHYQQMQVPSHSPHHQLFQQPIPEQLFQVMSHNMLTHYTIQQQDGFQQQQQQQQQTQQQPVDQMMNNSKRRRRMII